MSSSLLSRIKSINEMNDQELKNNIKSSASWHSKVRNFLT